MSCFQVTAPYLAQVILSDLGKSISTQGTAQVHYHCLSEPGPLKGVGWDLFQQKQEQPSVSELFLLPLPVAGAV